MPWTMLVCRLWALESVVGPPLLPASIRGERLSCGSEANELAADEAGEVRGSEGESCSSAGATLEKVGVVEEDGFRIWVGTLQGSTSRGSASSGCLSLRLSEVA